MTTDPSIAPVQPKAPPVARPYALYALGLLAFINILNYLDRNVIFALFEPIKQDLSLTDTQLGWLGSAYILVYSLAALPFGVISDLRSRRAVISWGVAIWSAFTFLGGFVRNYWQLFTCRAAVGIGEAAFAPAATSLVADYFPGKSRAAAMSVLASGLAVGGVLGLYLGGLFHEMFGWRVAFMLVGVPGLICAFLAARLRDPRPKKPPLTVRDYMRELEGGSREFALQFYPILLTVPFALLLGVVLDQVYGATSIVDVATVSALIGLGVVWQVWYWIRAIRSGKVERTPFGHEAGSAFDEVLDAGRRVVGTPTLALVFVAGAMISFGMNGIVGWGPAYLSRSLGLDAATGAKLLGISGLIAGTAGTLAGGFIADWFTKRTPRGRVLTAAAGFMIGGPMVIYLLTVRDVQMFRILFTVAFFFLSWYNGPMSAVIFDVVPSRVGATVAGAYFLFIHLAGDAIALPLIGVLSDRFGLERAVFLLPIVAVAGGCVLLFTSRTIARDMLRAQVEGAPAAATT